MAKQPDNIPDFKGYNGNVNIKKIGVEVQWTPELLLEYAKCEKDAAAEPTTMCNHLTDGRLFRKRTETLASITILPEEPISVTPRPGIATSDDCVIVISDSIRLASLISNDVPRAKSTTDIA